tara:strand:- start:152952 stop:153683 length:732 start_codon:yes stop_codon:yes gene_type:complete
MIISIYTFTMGRETYLSRLLDSVVREADCLLKVNPNATIEHKIVTQGIQNLDTLAAVKTMVDGIGDNTPNYKASVVEFEANLGIAEGMNKILPTLKGDLIIKMDDDCLIISTDFFQRVLDVHKLKPNAVFSPYPVGLINNPGGVPSKSHEVVKGEYFDTYYTLRGVGHIGGFCRVSPGNTKDWTFAPDLLPGISGNEDGQHSTKARQAGMHMYYLENAIVVEHQESTLGQHQRYGEDYFKGRF